MIDIRFHNDLILDPIYPITDSPIRTGLSYVEQAMQFLDAGIRFFQVRDQECEDRDLLEQLRSIMELCRSAQASCLINDRVDLALASGARGVHLGQTDLPVSVARRILGEHAIIGLSTHNREQFGAGLKEDVDYIAVGPIFPTQTKMSENPPLGTKTIDRFKSGCPLPLVAIGGITSENIQEVWSAGADSAAMISALSGRPGPKTKLHQLLGLYSR